MNTGKIGNRMKASTIAIAIAIAIAPFAVHNTAAAQASPGVQGTFVIKNANVWSNGMPQTNVNVVIRNGRIEAVGAGATAAGATEIDATGKWVYPGMIDAYTPLGLAEIGGIATMNMRSELGEFNPHMRAVIAVNVDSDMMAITRANGVTSAITAPSGGVLSGQAALINMAGWTTEDLAVKSTAAYIVNYPRAAVTGGRGGGGGGGGAQQGGAGANAQQRYEEQVRDLKRVFATAKQYEAQRKAGLETVDLAYEAMRPLMRGEIPALVSADTDDQIRGAIALGDTFGIRIVINGGRQAWKVRDLLAQKRVPVVLGALQSVPNADEPFDAIYSQPAILVDAGVRIAFSTGTSSSARHVPFHASLAVGYGLSKDAAMKALTIWPAEMFGASRDIGTIEAGKFANLFITTGDPLDIRSKVSEVFIKGRRVPMDDEHSRLYQKYNGRPAGGGN